MDVRKLALDEGIECIGNIMTKNHGISYVGIYCNNYEGKEVIAIESNLSLQLKRLIVLYFLIRKELGRIENEEVLGIFGEFDKEAMGLAYQRLILEHDNDYEEKNYVDANKVALDEIGLPKTLNYLKDYLFKKQKFDDVWREIK